jgi:outer membrane receptor protein involved in Fe transport
MKPNPFKFSAGLLFGLACALPAAAENDQVLEEIIVSGFRQKTALEADLSLSELDARTIHQAAVVHAEELISLVPNLNYSGEGSRARYLQLRGIGEREQYEGAPNPSVGLFIDDIDLSGIGGIATLFDVERLEVLRGPQSTRFGASALAGVVYMESASPSVETGATAELTAGNDGLLAAGAALGGALGSSARGRIALFRSGSDGFRHNVYLGANTNEREETTARGKLRWDFGQDWQGLMTLLYAENDNGYDAWTVRNDDQTHSDHPGRDEQETMAGSLRLEGPAGSGARLVSLTSAATTDVLFSFDGDWGNDSFWQQYGDYVYDYQYLNPRQRDTVSQEFRLVSGQDGRWFSDSTDWVIGIFWRRLDEDNQIDSTGRYDDSGEENWCPPCVTDRQVESQFESESLALFASTESALTDRVTLSLGLRLERWEASYRDRWSDINYHGPPGGTSCSEFDCDPDDDLWGGHAALSYRFNDAVRGYLRVARGFKAGGFNPSLAALQGVAQLGPEFIPYGPETLMNYELGLKGLWLAGALQADVSLFFMDRDQAQLSQSSQQVEFDPNSFVYVTYNGQADVYGLEASLQWALNDIFSLHGSLGLLESKIGDTDKTRTVSPDAVKRDLAHAPGYQLNLGASFLTPNGWFGRLDFNATDAFFYDISHDQQSIAYHSVNLRLGKTWDAWTLSAWSRNLTDEEYYTRGFWFGNEPPWFAPTLYTRFGDPRSYGLTLGYRYGNG